MDPVERHPLAPDAGFDGGDMDCGNGLLLLIRQHIDPLPRGGLLEIRSTDSSVEGDLPSWCRMTGNELVSWTKSGRQRSYLVCKGALAERGATPVVVPAIAAPAPVPSAPAGPPAPAPPIPTLAVLGIGSWPRPRWMVEALHAYLEGRLPEAEFQATADDAVRLAVDAQLKAGADVVSDGEQRRDSYASFVGSRLDNCRLIPLTDLLPLVEDPEKLRKEFETLDVPASKVRHPALFGKLGRSRPIAAHELPLVRSLTDRPVKVAIPGPYVLTRTLYMECLVNRPYATREELAEDVVKILREELAHLLAGGAAIVQLDEPVLSEVVFGGAKGGTSFMCGALGAKGEVQQELEFARGLVNRVVAGFPRERTALHVCRGNWTPDESAALAGDYRPLVGLLRALDVGTYFLEMATPRAGEIEVLRNLPSDRRLGVGVVNQKHERVESVEEIVEKGRRAISLFGRERVLLNPDCGFATFADNPVASARTASAKLEAMARAAEILRRA